jgi:hypothetical protein
VDVDVDVDDSWHGAGTTPRDCIPSPYNCVQTISIVRAPASRHVDVVRRAVQPRADEPKEAEAMPFNRPVPIVVIVLTAASANVRCGVEEASQGGAPLDVAVTQSALHASAGRATGTCGRTDAYLRVGVLDDLASSVAPQYADAHGGVHVPYAVMGYQSYGVDGFVIGGPVDLATELPFDYSPASDEEVRTRIQLSFGGYREATWQASAHGDGYRAARRLFRAMTRATESVEYETRWRRSPGGFVACGEWLGQGSGYTCTLTNPVMSRTSLVPCTRRGASVGW